MRVFVSYSLRDSGIANKVITRLSAEGLAVVWPDDQVFPGDNWALAMGQALEQADAMVVLLSPEALNSESVRREIGYALTQERFQNRLIPVQVRPTKAEPWMRLVAPRVDWHADPERASEDIVNALRAPASVPRGRRHAGRPRAHGLRQPARVSS